jgi:hypothetical protein
MIHWAVCALCVLVILKPHEVVGEIGSIPVVSLAFAVATAIVIAGLAMSRRRIAVAPHVPYVVLFFAWGLLTTTAMAPEALAETAVRMATAFLLFLLVTFGATSKEGLRALAVAFVGCASVLSAVAILQAHAPLGCLRGAAPDGDTRGDLVVDGRPCETVVECLQDAPDPRFGYRCEHVGPWGTSSIEGRIRYRGQLADPNELALATIVLGIPFMIAVAGSWGRRQERRSAPSRSSSDAARGAARGGDVHLEVRLFWGLLVLLVTGACAYVTVLSSSRAGILVLLITVGLQIMRRIGGWGIVTGCMLAPAAIAVGWRDTDEAGQSSDERKELLREGFDMVVRTRGVGVGVGQFARESSIGLTAHNSYLLSASETGIVGMFLFCMALYLSIKTSLAVWFCDRPAAAELRPAAAAVALALAAAAVGIFFLSWTYEDVLYILLGASAALYAAARAADPGFEVRSSGADELMVGLGMIGLLVGVRVVAR